MTATAVLTHLVEVEFKGNRRAFFTWTGEAPPPLRAAVIVQVERGEDLGRVHSTGELAEKRKAGTTHGKASPPDLPKVVRLATRKEVDTAVRLRADEDAVRKAALELVRELKLDMKVSDAEWQWDRRRLTCYFTAEERVDFRELVRRLERRFSTRVHMWHIGVRDEARRLDGIGRCGRQFCSASWLPELRPVKSSTAKDQRLSTLNPSQISGTCGRLMCCLRYEHEFYVQSRKRFPKEGKVLVTALGEEKVVSNDIFRDLVTLRNPAGESRTIPLAQLRRELGDGALPVDDEPTRDEDGPEETELVPLARAERPEGRAPQGRAGGQDAAARPGRDERGARPDRGSRVERPEGTGRPERGESGERRDRPDRPRNEGPRPERGTAPVPPHLAAPARTPVPPPTDAEAGDDGDDAEDEGEDAPVDGAPGAASAGDGRKRGRRRRGRRGGRRGRGGNGGGTPGGAPGGAPPAGPPTT